MNKSNSLSCAKISASSPAEIFAAERLSANSFFNALLRETNAGQWCMPPTGLSGFPPHAAAIRIDLSRQDAQLWLRVTYRSSCGRHQFGLPLVLVTANDDSQPISLADASALISREPRLFPSASAEQRQHFIERTQASIRNMAQAIAARYADLPAVFTYPLDFAAAEQALLAGHSMHPTPKSREPFSDADALKYAPEFGNSFALQWLAVKPSQLQTRSGCAYQADELAQQVWGSDGMNKPVPAGYVPVPMHPWQWQRLKVSEAIAPLLKNAAIIELGSNGKPWRATSSLRAIHASHSPYMLKFSLSLRLTNSLRTLLPHEMARGLEVLPIRATPIGREFANRYPNFQVLAEPAFLMLTGVDGSPLPESLVLFRENPFCDLVAQNTCLLATLTQDHPDGAPARAAQLITAHAQRHALSDDESARQWFEKFMDAVVEPLIIAQADFGLLYGAHQQNLIIVFEHELPKAGYFRDCQGTGYSQLGAALLKPYLPALGADTENVIDDLMANRLFAYYLIVNSCFGLISAIAAAGLSTERALLDLLRERLEHLQAGPRQDRSCLNYLLQSEQLWAKGNFHCAIIGMNETTSEDPLAIYHPLSNPLLRPNLL